MSLINKLFTSLQYALPHHLLTALAYRVTRIRQPRIKNWLIRHFISGFNVDMSEAKYPVPESYESFNQFFTRPLKAGLRNLNPRPEHVISPVDGAISQIGLIETDQIFQAKGHHYSVSDLLGGDSAEAKRFEGGSFATVYLSPRDYHRIHMPHDGNLISMTHVAGRLFSVNGATTEKVPGLFARNERVICIFDTPLGRMAHIMVGAMMVGSMETVWAGQITPVNKQKVRRWFYTEAKQPCLKQGEEMGRFNMGSTIIMLFEKDQMRWDADLHADSPVQLGQPLGKLTE